MALARARTGYFTLILSTTLPSLAQWCSQSLTIGPKGGAIGNIAWRPLLVSWRHRHFWALCRGGFITVPILLTVLSFAVDD